MFIHFLFFMVLVWVAKTVFVEVARESRRRRG